MDTTQFVQFAASKGYQLSEIIPDGHIHRFRPEGRTGKDGWYIFFVNGSVSIGVCGDWVSGEKYIWSANGNGKTITDSQRKIVQEKIEKAKQTREKERLKLQNKAADRAVHIWENAKPASSDHAYLKKKDVRSYGLKDYNGALVIPMHDIDGNIVSLQFINANGKKRFLKEGKKKGRTFIIKGKGRKTYLAEGYATGATVHKATGSTVKICFDKDNLGPVADNIRYQKPKAEIIICADHDRWTLGNPGIKTAREAAIRNRAKLTYPQFKNVSSKPTDFNDLYLLEGIDTVKEQIDRAIIPMSRPAGITAIDLIKKEFSEPKWAVPGLLPEGLNFLGGKPKQGKSIMAVNFGLAISIGDKALGSINVEQGTVIYFALEDTQRRLQGRIKQMLCDSRASDKLVFYTEWPRMGQGGLRALEEEIRCHDDVRLVIIDTWKLFRPISKATGQNLYDLDYEAVTPVKKLSERNSVSILMIHHLRKSAADDVFDTFSGSLGLTGAADGLLALSRVTGQADAELHINGRDLEAAEYAMKFHPDILSWQILGKADEVKSTKERQLLFDALKNADGPLGPKDLAKITGLKDQYIRNTLPILIKEGSVIKFDRGKYVYNGIREPQYVEDTIYKNNSFYKDIKDNEDNKDNEYNGDNGHKVSGMSSGGIKGEDILSGNNNGKLSENVLNVPGVPTKGTTSKINNKDDKAGESEIQTDPDLGPCPVCNGRDFIHDHKGGYFCAKCHKDPPEGNKIKAGRAENIDVPSFEEL